MNLSCLTAAEHAYISERLEHACLKFNDQPLPLGSQPHRGELGLESHARGVRLLVQRGVTYQGADTAAATFLRDGYVELEDLDAVTEWLRTRTEVMTAETIQRRISEHLQRHLVDQPTAIEVFSASCAQHIVKPAPSKPLVMLAGGPTGVGKTYTAELIVDALQTIQPDFGSYTVDCNEMGEPHRVASLLGAPPGYVGHGSAPRLLQSLRRGHPLMIVLDEFEKAHTDVQYAFMSAFATGRLQPADGSADIDVRRHLFFITTNLGDQALAQYRRDGRPDEQRENPDSSYRRILIGSGLNDAVVGRIDVVVPYEPLTPTATAALTVLAIRRLGAEFGHTIDYVDPAVALQIIDALPEFDALGARTVRRYAAQVLGGLLASTTPVSEVVSLTLDVHGEPTLIPTNHVLEQN